ncbi:microsomal epoxide hydrolase [Fusarium napiforme]|uniref:Microsomal epoxide hydrolase n=1 Tax=Fusarium napiforme TaxID=42672 RepID=A0A8H5NHT1_9HYPO|nr:microsomal epoxide hydrolase [Fusarium napiforme]
MSADQAATRPSLGFAALSSWIVSDRDQELLVFRKFGEISARNLLYLQSELLSIEARLKTWDKKVENSNDTTLEEVAETWEMTIEQANAGNPEAKEMLELVNQLHVKIKEYHEALDLQSKISQLNSPDERALQVARNELHGGPLRQDGQKPNPILGGRGKDYLDEAEDLVSLKAPVAVDPLSKLLRGYWPGREELSRDGWRRISHFDERSITIAVALVNILLAMVLLVGSISSLYYVKSAPAILGTICGFTILFALSVGLITNAKRAEIFAGSAAYAAVLVVFVGNGDQSGYGFAKIPSGAQVQPTPYRVSIADNKVDELKQLVKLGRVGPPTYESTQKEHNYGVSHQWLTDAKAAWIDFDWRAAEKHINSYNHWTVPIKDEKGDFTIHFTGLFSSKPDAVPVVMLHGWPGSFLEFLKILSILKERYTPETLPYHVIVPSLPGYAFSDKPPLDKDFGIRDVSRIVNSLMVQLGFGGGYIAQGGDIGSRISRVLAASYDECKAAHLNFCLMAEPATAQGEVSDAEKKGLERAKDFDKLGTAYALMHATRPSTIGLILSSSPLALLAWVGEKFLSWSDEDPPLDEILTSMSLYWLTDSFPTSVFPYRQRFDPDYPGAHDHPKWKISKPLGYSWFPFELAPIPVSWVKTTGNLVFWRDHERGGHFAALERPEDLLKDFGEFVEQISKDGSLKIQ